MSDSRKRVNRRTISGRQAAFDRVRQVEREDRRTRAAGKGCPEPVWDGPYKYRCGLGGGGTVCPRHGEFGHKRDAQEVTS
jgi:hypothetical protein